MKKILIIGAGFLQDFVIRKAVSMGYETIAIDADPHAIGFSHAHKYAVIDIVDEEACLDYAKNENIDGVLTAATDFGVLTASYIAEHLGLPGLHYEVAKLIKNKYKVRQCLYDNNVDDMSQSYLVSKTTNFSALKDKLKYPVIVKPCDGSGSRGTSRVDFESELESACYIAINNSLTKQAEIETFIEGEEYGVESIVVEGNVCVLGVMKKWMTKPPYYAELGHAFPSGLKPNIELKIKEYVTRAIKALGINHGSVNMDILVSNDYSIHIIDIGARMGGNMIGPCIIPYGTGIDYLSAIINGALGVPIDLSKNTSCSVVSKIMAFNEGIVTSVPDMEKIEKKYGVEIYHHIFNNMHINMYRSNLDGCGYIIAKDSSLDRAERNANRAMKEIEMSLR